MRHGTAGRLLGTVFLAFAVSLVGYGLYGLSRFALYTGEFFYDDRLIAFDNGVYPFLWGCLFLLLGQCLRLHLRRLFMGVAAAAGLLLLLWMRLTAPEVGNTNEKLFPDAELLDDLMAVCMAMLGLMLADRFVQRLIDIIVIKPSCLLWRKLNGPARSGL